MMFRRAGIALATMIVIGTSPYAMAGRTAPSDDILPVASREIASAPALTKVAWRNSEQSTHARPRQSRNAGLGTDGYRSRSGQQAPGAGYEGRGFQGSQVDDNNYQYWHQACCL